jgi:hypothetical protein
MIVHRRNNASRTSALTRSALFPFHAYDLVLPSVIVLENVTKRFGPVTAVDAVSWLQGISLVQQ